jgi:alpha-beta hydrolase superfamily lysophospholipase
MTVNGGPIDPTKRGTSMQHFGHLAPLGGLVAFMIGSTSVLAQQAAGALPETTTCPEAIASIATCYGIKHESGAYILAAMPKTWNGDLVVFAHGGPSLVPPTANGSKADLTKYAIAVKRGFGWVASSYRREGYGVGMAGQDSDAARRFFVERIAKPRHTYLHGASYGGLVGAKLVESLTKNADGSIDGALFNSGAVGGATLNYQHRVDLRAVYQYVCKNLPRPDEAQYPLWMGVASDAKMTLRDLDAVVDECTGVAHPAAQRSEQQKKNLADIIGVMGYPENLLVRHMQAATLLFRDIVKRTTSGRDPFDNTGVRYHGSSNDDELNRNVARFAADPAAVAALKADGDPTGKLPIPVVSIHSINDPQVPVEQQAAYRDTVAAAGSTNRLVQAYTDERAHTGQSAPELAAALDALVQWVEKGTKPTAQSIAAACEQFRATFEGPCAWHPEFTPKPYGTKFYPREAAVR